MKVLVTGGAGYIGSHVVYELIRENHEVTVLDNLSTGNREAVHKGAKFIEGDQLDVKCLDDIFSKNKFDVVMHFSAKLIVPESVEEPIKYFENNVHGVSMLLEAMKNHNVKNIVFSSTAAVYGNTKEDPINEDSYKEPITPYGQSKRACEWLIEGVHKAYGFNYSIFRYFNVAGADASGEIGQSTKGRTLTHLIPVITEATIGIRDKISVFGNDYETKDGTCVRDYIHVTDLAKAHILGAKYAMSGKSNIFNLGSTTGYSVMEVINATEKALDKQVPWEMAGRREGDPARSVASTERVRKELGFEIKHNLEEMIKADFKWRENKKF